MTLSRTSATETALRSIALMADGDLSDFTEVIHPEAVNRESVGEPPATRGRGPAAFHATAMWLRSAYADIDFAVDTVVTDGDLVVTHGTMAGRHTGDFVVFDADGAVRRAFAPTGARFTVRHAHFQRLRDGLVIEHWAVRDDLGQAEQLGWVPPSIAHLYRCARATRRARRVAGSAAASTIG